VAIATLGALSSFALLKSSDFADFFGTKPRHFKQFIQFPFAFISFVLSCGFSPNEICGQAFFQR
jgi:hypothetical protein